MGLGAVYVRKYNIIMVVMKEERKKNIAACVLAGGQSKRMGRPKHSVVIPGDGRTFLDRICDEIDHVYPSVISGRYISLRADQNIERDGYKYFMILDDIRVNVLVPIVSLFYLCSLCFYLLCGLR